VLKFGDGKDCAVDEHGKAVSKISGVCHIVLFIA
jgi:hypothetical protein